MVISVETKSMHSEGEKKTAKKRRSRWKTLLFILLLFLIAIPILVYFLIQLPSIQNKIVDWAAGKASEQLNMDVQVGEAGLEVFGTEGLQLKEVFIVDPEHQDTVLFVGSLSTSLTENLRSLFNGGLYTDVLDLKNVRILNKVHQGEQISALESIFQQRNAYDPNAAEREPFKFDINMFLLEDVVYEELDENNGSQKTFRIKKGSVKVDILDLEKNHIVLDEVILDAPEAILDLFAQAIVEETEIDEVLEETKKPFKFDYAINTLKISSEIAFTKRGISLSRLNFKTDHSHVSNKLALKYRNFDAFLDFNNKVILDGQFENAYFAIDELVYFIPQLYESAFFKQNYKEKLYLNGRIRGKINNLRGQDLSINLADKIFVEGNIDTRDISNSDDMLINLKLKKLNTNIQDLRNLIPGFNPPLLIWICV